MSDLQSILAFLDQVQATAGAATGESLFKQWSGNSYEWDATSDLEKERWNRLAAKFQSPKTEQALRVAVEGLEKHARSAEASEHDDAEETLHTIATLCHEHP